MLTALRELWPYLVIQVTFFYRNALLITSWLNMIYDFGFEYVYEFSILENK